MAKTPRHSRPEPNDVNARSRRTGTPAADPHKGRHASAASAKSNGKRTIVVVVAAMLALCIAGVLAWFFLWSDSDADKIQGIWRVPQTQATVTITESEIQLTQDVSYAYTIDPFNHTMGLSFFGAQGSAAYALTHGGDMLTITESLEGEDGQSYVQTLVLVRPGSEAETEYLEEQAAASADASSSDAASSGEAGATTAAPDAAATDGMAGEAPSGNAAATDGTAGEASSGDAADAAAQQDAQDGQS